MENEKYLFVVSGPAGVGKDSVIGRVRAAHPEIEKTISATTRAPRAGEAEGVNYYYRSQEEFARMLERGDIIESNLFCNNYYGTPKAEVDRRIRDGKAVLLNIDVHGALNVKRLYPGSTIIFLLPPSQQVLESRLRGRGTDSEESIRLRLDTAREELARAGEFDFRIVNDTVEQAAAELYAVMARRAGLPE